MDVRRFDRGELNSIIYGAAVEFSAQYGMHIRSQVDGHIVLQDGQFSYDLKVLPSPSRKKSEPYELKVRWNVGKVERDVMWKSRQLMKILNGIIAKELLEKLKHADERPVVHSI